MIDERAEILVATDLSRASRHAYAWAAGIARAYGSRVTLLHVDEVSPAVAVTEEVGAYLDQLSARREALLEAARQQFEDWGIEARVETCKGTASRLIISTATRRKVGLVVVSKSGGRVREQLLFGSTTKRVLRSAALPVLVVHQPSGQGRLRDDPVDFGRLMITTDLGETSDRPVTMVLRLADVLGSREVLLTHVVRTLPPVDRAQPHPEGLLEPARRAATLAMQQVVERLGTNSRLRPRLLVGSAVAQTLAETANAENVDLVVVPSHARTPDGVPFGHTAEALLRRVMRPVLVLPWQYLERG